MHAAFTRAVGQTGIFAGQIWRIPDSLMTFADADPAKRTIHPDRPVLVVQGDDHADNGGLSRPFRQLEVLSAPTAEARGGGCAGYTLLKSP